MVDLKNRILCGTVLALFAVVSLTSKAGIVVYPEYDARIERDNAYEVRVSQGSEKRQLTVYNHCEKSMLETRTRGGDVNRRFCPVANPEAISLRLFLDRSCLEVFVEEGREVLTANVYPDPEDEGISFFAQGGSAQFRDLVHYELNP